jgi:8-oxo-dGTP pyrophosphatase MutT (NUDIX family)
MSEDTKDEPEAVPDVTLEVLDEQTDPREAGFLRVRRLTLRNLYPDGTRSAPYRYDVVERDATDAVALVLESADGRIALRTALRPPLAFRGRYAVPQERDLHPVLWEIPAGLVEPGETGEAGLRSCAVRETREEVGLELAPADFQRLGPAVCLSPGVLAERIHFMHARVEPEARGVPLEDGSPTEERAEIRFVSTHAALRATQSGSITDIKTELAIRRLMQARA